jgi:hypothetical protein
VSFRKFAKAVKSAACQQGMSIFKENFVVQIPDASTFYGLYFFEKSS